MGKDSVWLILTMFSLICKNQATGESSGENTNQMFSL
jgi:hypothetical protein